jgi:hypothetical protein
LYTYSLDSVLWSEVAPGTTCPAPLVKVGRVHNQVKIQQPIGNDVSGLYVGVTSHQAFYIDTGLREGSPTLIDLYPLTPYGCRKKIHAGRAMGVELVVREGRNVYTVKSGMDCQGANCGMKKGSLWVAWFVSIDGGLFNVFIRKNRRCTVADSCTRYNSGDMLFGSTACGSSSVPPPLIFYTHDRPRKSVRDFPALAKKALQSFEMREGVITLPSLIPASFVSAPPPTVPPPSLTAGSSLLRVVDLPVPTSAPPPPPPPPFSQPAPLRFVTATAPLMSGLVQPPLLDLGRFDRQTGQAILSFLGNSMLVGSQPPEPLLL